MLDHTLSAPPSDGAASRPASGEWQPLRLATLAPEHCEALNAAYRQLGGRKVPLARNVRASIHWRQSEPAIADPWTLTIGINDGRAELILPEKLLGYILAAADPGLRFAALAEKLQPLVVEYALRDALEALEAAWDSRLAVLAVSPGRPAATPPGMVSLPCLTELRGADPLWCAVRLEAERLPRLAGHFRSIAEAAPRIDMPLPLRLRWASVELTRAELRSLAPGDIVLVDASCPQPGLALAVIGEHLVAPVELSRMGYRFGSQPQRGSASSFGWGLDRPPLGPAEDAAPGALPMRIFFEYGRMEIDRSAAAELRGGTLLPLVRPLEEGLDIVAGGVRIGRGEPVTIGTAVGVRVTRI